MASIRGQLVALIERGAILDEQVGRAVRSSGLYPSSRAWYVFLDRMLLWLGCLALACAALFLIAYNWSDMGRWLRLGLVEAALVLSIAVYCVAGEMMARVALTAAALLLGGLLALFGQVYQTGADSWQLFFYWALLMLPWVLVARFAVLWVFWLGLLNLAVILYFRTWGGVFDAVFGSDTSALWWLFLLNTSALFLWELGARYGYWLLATWATRLLALGSGLPITVLMMIYALDERAAFSLTLPAYPLWLAALYATYRHWRFELFMLAGGCLSAIVVTVLFLARYLLLEAEAGGFLLLAVVVLALGAAAVLWLKRLHAEMPS